MANTTSNNQGFEYDDDDDVRAYRTLRQINVCGAPAAPHTPTRQASHSHRRVCPNAPARPSSHPKKTLPRSSAVRSMDSPRFPSLEVLLALARTERQGAPNALARTASSESPVGADALITEVETHDDVTDPQQDGY